MAIDDAAKSLFTKPAKTGEEVRQAFAERAMMEAVKGSWLWRHYAHVVQPPATDGACERVCEELLRMAFADQAVAGVKLSQPWDDFIGEFRSPDRPTQRLPSNLERYAGNYINIAFAAGVVVAALLAHPVLVLALVVLQVVALCGPPEVFDVHLLLPANYGGIRDLGGARLRLRVTLGAHAGLWAVAVLTHGGRVGLFWGGVVSLVHAYFRTRPWTDVAKDKLLSGIMKMKEGEDKLKAGLKKMM